jgi:hypothetical protein
VRDPIFIIPIYKNRQNSNQGAMIAPAIQRQDHGLNDQGNVLGFPGRGKRFISSPKHPDDLRPNQPLVQWEAQHLSQA